jgi:transcriptional regulator with GAF, ATPase, and Fis domain
MLNMTVVRNKDAEIANGIRINTGREFMVDENEFFRQATLLIYGSMQLDTTLKKLMAYLETYMPISGINLGLLDLSLNIGIMLSTIYPPHWKQPPVAVPMFLNVGNWTERYWGNNFDIKIVNDIMKVEPEIRAAILKILPEESSHIIMGFELEKTRYGCLVIFAEGKHRYNETHARLISLLRQPFAQAMTNIIQYNEILRLKDMLADDNRFLQNQLLEISGDKIIGAEYGLGNVMAMVRQVSSLKSPVLLLGETGVGKEVIANAIHFSSQRRKQPYIKVNCGAIAGPLIDSELFGHEKGAFTGAASQKRGRFERAHTGTIFLDEIGELPMEAQVRLLRVLQQHEIERVGGTQTIPIDVRIVSATHRNLEEMVRTGRFREDLWFRLNVFPIVIPPLRQRKEDIPALVNHFIERKSREMKIQTIPSLAPGAMETILTYSWPGNVRELENLVERAIIQSQITGHPLVLDFDALLAGSNGSQANYPGKTNDQILRLDTLIAAHIKKALAHTHGKVDGKNGVAKMLGIHPSTLRAKMRKLKIPYGRNHK